MSDTRKDRRAPVSLKVRFKSATVDEFVEQYAMDISRGGIFIKSKSPMPIGTLLKFEFQLKDESRLIHGVGRVVWKRDGDGGVEKPPGMGIKFIKMDPQSRSLVEQIAAERGDAPGEFEQGRTKIKSAKKTQAFFPAALPQSELPAPEDSTQVRHASEFLAEALSAGDEDAAKEAAESAEKARQRTEEIAKEREEAARREKEAAKHGAEEPTEEPAEEPVAEEPVAEEPAEEPAAEEPAAEEPAADEPAADEPEEEDAETPTRPSTPAEEAAGHLASAKSAAAEKEAEQAARAEAEAEARRRETEAAATQKASSRPPRGAARDDAGAPEEPRSMTIPILLGVVAVAAVGFYIYNQSQGGTETPPVEPPIADIEDPETDPETEPDAGALAVEDEGTIPADAEMVSVRVASSPPGATVLVGGEARGEAPLEVELPLGYEVEVSVQQDGYVTGRLMVTAEAEQEALTFALEEMPWVVVVDVNPAEARVTVGRDTPNEDGEIVLGGEPRGPVTVNASAPGHTSGSQEILLPSFTQDGERMLARVTIELEERRGGRPAAMGMVAAMMVASMGTGEEEVGGDPTMDTPTMDAPAMDTAAMDPPTMDVPTMDAPPPTMDAPTMDVPTMADPPPPSMDVPENPF